MSTGSWKREICRCGVCRKCKNRELKRLKRSGEWKPYVKRGGARERAILERKRVKQEMKDSKAEKKAVARAARQRRSVAFKRNVDRFGLAKAKWIAEWITKQRRQRSVVAPNNIVGN